MKRLWRVPLAWRRLGLVLALLAAVAAGHERAVLFDLGPEEYGRSVRAFSAGQGDVGVAARRPGARIPYVLPGPDDPWAGGVPHELRLVFARQPGRALRLYLEAVETHHAAPPLLVVTLDGRTLTTVRTRHGTGLPPPHAGRGTRSTYVVPIPADAVAGAADTLLSVRNEAGSWVMWRGIRLVEAHPSLALAHLGLTGRLPPLAAVLLLASAGSLAVAALPRALAAGRVPSLVHVGGPVLGLVALALAAAAVFPDAVPRWAWLLLPWLLVALPPPLAAGARVPWRPAWALLALGGLLCVAFPDVVLGGRTLLTSAYSGSVMGVRPAYGYPWEFPPFEHNVVDPGASAWQYEPLTAKAARLYRAGRLPLWNANQGFGAPLAANMHSSVFYPPALPLLLFPSPAMWDAFLLGRLLLAGALTFFFIRSLGTGLVGGVGAASAFMLGGYLMLWVNNSWLNVDILVPALLWGIEKVLAEGSRRALALLAAAVSGAVLGGMPESTFVVVLFAGCYGAFRVVSRARAGESRRRLVSRSAAVVVTGLLGAGASAVLLLPFLEYVRNAFQAHTPDNRIGLIHLPLAQLVTLLVPYLEGTASGSNATTFYYSGMVAATLAAAAVVARRHERSGLAWFFAAAVVFSLAKAFGVGVNWVGSWPVFDLVFFWKHLGVVISFSLAVLAGLGLDAIAEGRLTLRRALTASLLVTACGAAALALYWSAFGLTPRRALVASMGAAAGALILQAALLALGGTGQRARVVAACSLAVLAAELVYLVPRGERPRRYPADVPPPAVEFVRADPQPHRVFGVDRTLHPNASSFLDLEDVRAMDALYPDRYYRYVTRLIQPEIVAWSTGTAEPPSRCGGNPWFDLTGVRYVFTRASRPLHECDSGRPLIADALAAAGPHPDLRATAFTIEGIRRDVLPQPAPREIRLPLVPDVRTPVLAFSLALHPDVWTPEKGDGVWFDVAVLTGSRRVPLFSRWVDPKNERGDRRWIDGSVDLGDYVGQEVVLLLSTRPGASSLWDWAGWGSLRLTSHQYTLAWDPGKEDLRVYRNAHAFPRAFVAHAVVPVTGADAAMARMSEPGFDPGRQVVVEGLPPDIAASLRADGPPSPITPATIVRYEDERVTLEVRAGAPGVLVLTDVFYPGWVARVDGAPAPVYPADYAFRGVVVPAGEHVVEFEYRPASFRLGAAISLASIVSLLFFVVLAGDGRARKTAGRWCQAPRIGPAV
jgi:hypothetical protein